LFDLHLSAFSGAVPIFGVIEDIRIPQKYYRSVSRSGTTLQVCQQLNRNCTGIEVNPEYVTLTKERLEQPFIGFDSIDERMERVPNALNDIHIRNEYLNKHKNWFLKYHPNAIYLKKRRGTLRGWAGMLLEQAGILHLASQYHPELSGGELRRVALRRLCSTGLNC
jgi:ABC-type histidine transport system ATPase subunit